MTTTPDYAAQVKQATDLKQCEWQAWLTYYRLRWHRWRGQYEEAYQDARLLLALMTKMHRLREEATK